MSKNKSGVALLWGNEAGGKFLRLSAELLFHFKQIGMSEEDMIIICWIDLHQWGVKPAFPHPAKLAYILNTDEESAVDKLVSLRDRGFIILEATKTNSRNYHQDIKPTRLKLQQFLYEKPDHCEPLKRKSDKRIDTSIKRQKGLIDTSIPFNNISSIGDEIKKRGLNDIK
jgi:hypothetical protein